MADFIITHRIEAPELAAALNNLADALRGRPVAESPVGEERKVVQFTPAQVEPAPDTAVNPIAAPATNTVNGNVPATISAPTVVAPTPAPNTAPAPATAATSNAVTFDDITAAGSQLLDMGRMNDLMELLKGFGVQAVTQLKPEQYADVAAGLRGLGAKI